MKQHFLVTGGAGFIGSNYVSRLIKRGEKVTVYDNLSRAGSKLNLQWLENEYGKGSFDLIYGDIRNGELLRQSALESDVIVHLAGQVAVTTSVTNPREDFDINAMGTLNILEAARSSGKKPIIIYASTNKVYGGMEDVKITEEKDDYRYTDYPYGISEQRPLDFHSPYGCSKGCGDQYIHDYHRIYGLPTVVFRQSCIYGTRQFGMEDQGWVAWFIIAAITGKPISIYGDGKQVRDVLFVEDLLDAYDAALKNIENSAGQIFNVGGGYQKTLSVWKQFEPILERLIGHPIPVKWGDWRPGDQRIYISDIRKAETCLGWKPKIGVEEGINRLFEWVKSNHQLFL
jgi:CDP-paratose 2-epimerase